MEINHRIISYLVLFSLFCQIIPQNYEAISNDISLCLDNKDIDTCSNVILSSGFYQCCKVTLTTYYSSDSICSIQVTPITPFKQMMEDKSIKALYKEISGYLIYGYANSESQEYLKSKTEYQCKDGTATYLFGYDTYTDDEINLFKSGNHCMKYFYDNYLLNSKDDCFNSKITQASKNAGLSCGYYEFNLKYSDGTSESYKSCNIFNKAIIDYQKVDDKTKENFETFVSTNQNGEKIVLSYSVQFSDSSGNKFVYDSLSQKIMTNGNDQTNNSVIHSISKYLTLIIGLLFL
jgi:hypothetical protein